LVDGILIETEAIKAVILQSNFPPKQLPTRKAKLVKTGTVKGRHEHSIYLFSKEELFSFTA
jgi:hypothetical protein